MSVEEMPALQPVGAAQAAERQRAEPGPPTFGGEHIRLSELRGRTVVLNLYASWCPPCRAEARTLAAAAEAYADGGGTFLGINVWDSDADARPPAMGRW